MNAHALIMLVLSMPAAAAAATAVERWPLPASAAASQPSLGKGPDGTLNLSWIERRGDGHRLRMARYRDGRWLPATTIAEGGNWFVNWADFPSSTQLPDGTLWAHNLVKSADGTYAYDVVLYRSKDGGKTWSKPVTVNDDGTATEHGFATLWPWSRGELAIAWLDGRQTAGSAAHAGHDGAQGVDLGKAMTLRAAVFDGAGGAWDRVHVIEAQRGGRTEFVDETLTHAGLERRGIATVAQGRADGEAVERVLHHLELADLG